MQPESQQASSSQQGMQVLRLDKLLPFNTQKFDKIYSGQYLTIINPVNIQERVPIVSGSIDKKTTQILGIQFIRAGNNQNNLVIQWTTQPSVAKFLRKVVVPYGTSVQAIMKSAKNYSVSLGQKTPQTILENQQKLKQQRNRIRKDQQINRRRIAQLLALQNQKRVPSMQQFNKDLQIEQHKNLGIGEMQLIDAQLKKAFDVNQEFSKWHTFTWTAFLQIRRMLQNTQQYTREIIWNDLLVNRYYQTAANIEYTLRLTNLHESKEPIHFITRQGLYQLYVNYIAFTKTNKYPQNTQSFNQWIKYIIAKNPAVMSVMLKQPQVNLQSLTRFQQYVQPFIPVTQLQQQYHFVQKTSITGINQASLSQFYNRIYFYTKQSQKSQQFKLPKFLKFNQYLEIHAPGQGIVNYTQFPKIGKSPLYQYTSQYQMLQQQVVFVLNGQQSIFNNQGYKTASLLLLNAISLVRREGQNVYYFMTKYFDFVRRNSSYLRYQQAQYFYDKFNSVLAQYLMFNQSGSVQIVGMLSYSYQNQLVGAFQQDAITRKHGFKITGLVQSQGYLKNGEILAQQLNKQAGNLTSNNYLGAQVIFQANSIRLYNPHRMQLYICMQQALQQNLTSLDKGGLPQFLTTSLQYLMLLKGQGYLDLAVYQASNGYYGWNDKDYNCMMNVYKEMCAKTNNQPVQSDMQRIKLGDFIKILDQHKWNYRYLGCKHLTKLYNTSFKQQVVLLPRHCWIQKRKKQKKYQQTYQLCSPPKGNQQTMYDAINNTFSLDIQCYAVQQQVQQCYLLCCYGKLKGVQMDMKWCMKQSITGAYSSPIDEFCEWLCDYVSRQLSQIGNKTSITIWTYNGSKYQNKYLIGALLRRVKQIKSLGSTTNSKGLILFGGLVRILDVKMLVGSGSLQTNSKIYNSKQHRKSKYQLLPKCYKDYCQQFKDVVKYCRQDCIATFYLARNFYKYLWKTINLITNDKPPMQQYQIYQSWTASQVGIMIMRKIYSKQNSVLAQTSGQYLAIQRQSYSGGMVQCFRVAYRGPCFSIDINGMYPYAMIQLLPFTRKTAYILLSDKTMLHTQITKILSTNSEYLQQIDLTLYRVNRFVITYSTVTFIPIRTKKSGLAYPLQHNQSVWVWGHTIRYLMRRGAHFQLQGYIRYSSKDAQGNQCIFIKQFIEQVYQLRRKYKIHISQTTKQIKTIKQVIAQADQTLKALKSLQLQELQAQLQQLTLISDMLKLWMNSAYGKFGERVFNQTVITNASSACFSNIKQQTYAQGYNVYQFESQKVTGPGNLVRLASYITSFARLHLSMNIDKVGWWNCLYCDTDSITVIGTPQNYPSSSQLGKFKVQKQYQNALFLAPKLGFLKNKDKTEAVYTIKSKGINFTKVAEPQKVIQKCWQVVQNLITDKQLFSNRTINITQVHGCERWVQAKGKKQGNIIQKFTKMVNYIQKREYDYETGLLNPTNKI